MLNVMIPEWLMKILACPICKGDVRQEEDKIICDKCRKKYPCKRGNDFDIPIMLVDRAEDF
jgi:uncharacterized protein YbaR (Trm112 family)